MNKNKGGIDEPIDKKASKNKKKRKRIRYNASRSQKYNSFELTNKRMNELES